MIGVSCLMQYMKVSITYLPREEVEIKSQVSNLVQAATKIFIDRKTTTGKKTLLLLDSKINNELNF